MPIARETERESRILDEFAEVMGHEYRRRVLFLLYCDRSTPLTVPEDLVNEEPDPDQFLASLVHVHLPKLESYGYVDWNRDAWCVSRGERFDRLEPLLEVLEMYYDFVVPLSDSGRTA